MFGLQIIFDPNVMTLVPRSDRMTYRARRPKYGVRRKKSPKRPQKAFVARAWLCRGRRCAPRLIAKPAMFMMGNRLIAHPSMRSEIERIIGNK